MNTAPVEADPMLGTSVVMSHSGLAIFTDLRTNKPGVYSLSFTARAGGHLLVWRLDDLKVTPLFVRRLTLLRSPQNDTFVGSALATQPIVQLLDASGNRVLNDKVCQAVTATIARTNVTNPQGGLIPLSDVLLFGQAPGNVERYCEERAGFVRCVVTANAVDSIVAFSALQMTVGAADGLVVNFTTGCCEPDPDLCFCASPINPLRVDLTRPTASTVTEPCRWIATSPFSIKRPIAALRVDRQPLLQYGAGDSITVDVAVLDGSGDVLRGGSTMLTAEVAGNGQTRLYGSVSVTPRDGVAHFDGLFFGSLYDGSQYRLRVFYGANIYVETAAFTVVAGAPAALVVSDIDSLTTTDNPLYVHTQTRRPTHTIYVLVHACMY